MKLFEKCLPKLLEVTTVYTGQQSVSTAAADDLVFCDRVVLQYYSIAVLSLLFDMDEPSLRIDDPCCLSLHARRLHG